MSVRGIRRPLLRAVAGTGVALLALTGCSNDSDEPDTNTSANTDSATATGEDAESTENAKPFDKASAQGVLLTADEIGEGYSAVPSEQVDQALAQGTGGLADTMDTIQVEPAQCGSAIKEAFTRTGDLAEALDQTAIAMFVKGTDFASQSIAPASTVTGEIGIPDGCAQMTLTIAGMTAEASLVPVDIDLGDESVGLIMQITINAGGQQVDQLSAQSIVVQGGAAMSISLSGADANEAKLSELTEKAYAKAEPVFG